MTRAMQHNAAVLHVDRSLMDQANAGTRPPSQA
jgi:hypothetical protein